MQPTTRALLALAASLLALLYLLPTFIALGRDAAARAEVVALNVLLGWTVAGWVFALVLAVGPRRPRPPAPSPTRPLPRPASSPRRSSVYVDGMYLVSSGPDTHTWAIREDGRWRIVYEIGGEERLVGEVAETDVPLSVLATALAPSEAVQ